MAKVEALRIKAKVLKIKVSEAAKGKDRNDKTTRVLRKSLKRVQRKVRAMTGKKLPAKTEDGKPAAAPKS